ncbi:MAG: 30S ribosomal protein S1 [Terracidiphilus sp.]|jgi:small subunit ribosomal protein S1
MANVVNPETESETLNAELETPTLDPATELENLASVDQPSRESTSTPENAAVVEALPLDADALTEPAAQVVPLLEPAPPETRAEAAPEAEAPEPPAAAVAPPAFESAPPAEPPPAPAVTAQAEAPEPPAAAVAPPAFESAPPAEPPPAPAVETAAPVVEAPAPLAPAPAVATRAPATAAEPAEDFSSALAAFEREQAAEAAAVEAYGDKLVSGKVVEQREKFLVVDVGLKSEGLVPLEQVLDQTGAVRFQPGDEIDVVIEREESEGGYLVSYERAQRLRVWDTIERAASEKTPITGTVVSRVKGGLTVDIGIKAFLPGSQLEIRPVRNLDTYLGQPIEVRIIKLNKKRGNVVVSRKEILEEEQNAKRSATMEHLAEGAVLTGTVKNLTDYGAFVDLGGIDGLLHITDMSWGRLTHPRDLVNVSDEIQVKVLKFDKDKQRVSLGFKQLTPDPWLDAAERYPIGAKVHGRVLSVTDYGAFVELEQGIEGLVHLSEMTWSKRLKHPSKMVKPGDEVDTVVLSVNPADRRISLGMKQLMENPWENLTDKYPVGTIIEGRVRNLTDFGAFIEIEDGIDGLVHVSNLSWIKRVKHPSEVVKKGEKVKAVVLGVEPQNRRLSLGIKQLQPDVWESFFASHRVGDLVHGKILRTAQFGAFVEIAEGVEGLCHISEAGDPVDGHSPIEQGLENDFKIIKINVEEKKVGLSLRAANGQEASRVTVESYKADTHKHPVSSSTTTLGDLVNWRKGER